MDVKNQKLKVKCKNCGQAIILTFNTQRCPKCSYNFDAEEVQHVFYNYESQLVNSTAYKTSQGLKTTSSFLKGSGSFLQNLGCISCLLPFAILGIIIILAFLF